MRFNTLDSSITHKMMIAYRDGQENVIIFNEFDMTVTDVKVDEETECLAEFVTKDTAVTRDYKIAFTESTDAAVNEW
jgi:hypothetical protein